MIKVDNKAKKQTRFPQVNFVPKDPFYESLVGKVSLWALRVGRYIVIFTEIIVVMSFASRFKLDRDLTDLNTSITQKTNVVLSYADTEKNMRLIQKRSEIVAKTLQENIPLKQFDLLISLVPNDVKLTRLSYNVDELMLAGTARSSTSLASFLGLIQKNPSFKGVSLDQVTTGDKKDPGFNFGMRITLNDKPKTSAKTSNSAPPSDTETP